MSLVKSRIPAALESIIKRRWLSADGDARFNSFETRAILHSYWADHDRFILLIGDRQFQTLASNMHRIYGTPIPGVGFFHSSNGYRSLISVEARQIAIGGMTLRSGYDFALSCLPNSSLLVHDVGIDLRTDDDKHRPHYTLPILFCAFASADMKLESAFADLETMLIRAVGAHIKRVPLNAA